MEPQLGRARPADVARIEKGRRTKATLVASARQLMGIHGVDATTFQMISAAAGVSIGAIQGHFGSKSGLVLAVYDEVLADERAFQRAVVAELKDATEPADDLVARLWDGYSVERMNFIFDVERMARRDEALAVDVQLVMEAHRIDTVAFARALGERDRANFRARLNAVLVALIGLGAVRHLISAEVLESTLRCIADNARTSLGASRRQVAHGEATADA